MKLRSLRVKLTLCFGVLLLLMCGGLYIVSAVISRNVVSSVIDESLYQLTKESTKVIAERVNAQLDTLAALAETDAIKGDTLTLDEKLKLRKEPLQQATLIRCRRN